MKTLVIAVAVVATLAYAVWARPNGAYSINVHFVPALHRANCTLGQTWMPTDLKCATCICFSRQMSRCVPTRGCNPLASTTAAPNATDVTAVTSPTMATDPKPPGDAEANPEAPPATSR